MTMNELFENAVRADWKRHLASTKADLEKARRPEAKLPRKRDEARRQRYVRGLERFIAVLEARLAADRV